MFGAFLVIGAWGLAVGAVLVACRELAGEQRARQAAPFVALVPAAIWAGTSSDALFAGVGALAVAGMVVAVVRRRGVLAAISGAVLRRRSVAELQLGSARLRSRYWWRRVSVALGN